MSSRFAALVRHLFARPATRAARRAHLRCEALEDRTTPTASVTVSNYGDPTEGGYPGMLEFFLQGPSRTSR